MTNLKLYGAYEVERVVFMANDVDDVAGRGQRHTYKYDTENLLFTQYVLIDGVWYFSYFDTIESRFRLQKAGADVEASLNATRKNNSNDILDTDTLDDSAKELIRRLRKDVDELTDKLKSPDGQEQNAVKYFLHQAHKQCVNIAESYGISQQDVLPGRNDVFTDLLKY